MVIEFKNYQEVTVEGEQIKDEDLTIDEAQFSRDDILILEHPVYGKYVMKTLKTDDIDDKVDVVMDSHPDEI